MASTPAPRLILASQSPRRAELLAAAGFLFETRPVGVDESALAGENPADYVARVARAKVFGLPRPDASTVVLGADTVVLVDGETLGKPVDDRDAARMLRLLSGRAHAVLTGVALRAGDRLLEAVESTTVRFSLLQDDEIEWYVATGEPRDKAGAYAIQGRASRFVDRVEGSYSNVVGLPVATVYRLMRQLSPWLT